MFTRRDHVAVAVSGGKDSLTLLLVLKKLMSKFPQTKMTAVTIDEGISGYREEAVEIASDYCKRLDIPQQVLSFEELYGLGLDDFLRTKHMRMSACSYCGVFRRKAINLAARKIGATKIATAHNLDDMVQTYLLNIFQGDVNRFARFSPVLADSKGRFLPRLKPFCEIPERETAFYGYLEGLQFQTASCPYMMEALRNELRSIVNRLEISHPGTLYAAYATMTKMHKLLLNSTIARNDLKECNSCGEPTSFDTCEACKMQHGQLVEIS
jgi:uncharacterized protein (TIGR00269 family)